MSIANVSKTEVIEKLALELKKVADIKPPQWSQFVKTGSQAERPPVNPDWWYVRTASILLKLNNLGPVGVSKLRIKYGGRKNRGMAPERFRKSSGKIIRIILQQLEKAGFAKQAVKGLHKGRIITPKGIAFAEKVSYALMKQDNIIIPQKITSAEKTPTPAQNAEPQAQSAPTEEKIKKPRAPKKPKKTEQTGETKNE